MIKESPLYGTVSVEANMDGTWTPLIADATGVSIRRGGVRDGFGIKTDVGLCTFRLLNAQDPMADGALRPGLNVRVTTGSDFTQDFSASTEGWTAYPGSGAVVSRGSAAASGHNGSTGYLSVTTFSAATAPQAVLAKTDLIVGEVYTFEAWVLANQASNVIARLWSSASSAGSSTTVDNTAWVKLTHTFTADAPTVSLYIGQTYQSGVRSMRVDDVHLSNTHPRVFTGRIAHLNSVYPLNKQTGESRAVTEVTVADAVHIHGSTMRYGAIVPVTSVKQVAVNLIPDPGTNGLAGLWSGGSASINVNDPSWSISGDGDSILVQSPTSSDSFLAVGPASGLNFGVQPGKTYVFSATGNMKTLGSGTAHARARRLVVFYKRSGDSTTYDVLSPTVVPNATNTPTRVSLEFTVPSNATDVFFRAYLGHTAGQIRWDGFRLSEKDDTPTADNITFFDGDTPNTADYRYEWNGLPSASTSTRTPEVESETYESRINRLAQSAHAPIEIPVQGAPKEVYSF